MNGESTSQMDLCMCMLLLGEEQWPLLAVVYIAAGTEGGRGSWGRRDRESSAQALAGDGRNDQQSAAARKEFLAVTARDGHAQRAPSWLLHRLCPSMSISPLRDTSTHADGSSPHPSRLYVRDLASFPTRNY
jgi:hypothetical protein